MSPAVEAFLAGPPVPLSTEAPRCTAACHRALSPAEARVRAALAARKGKPKKGKR